MTRLIESNTTIPTKSEVFQLPVIINLVALQKIHDYYRVNLNEQKSKQKGNSMFNPLMIYHQLRWGFLELSNFLILSTETVFCTLPQR